MSQILNNALDLLAANRDKFDIYRDLLLRWNDKINLTSIINPSDIDELHFLDSIQPLSLIVPRETLISPLTVIDIGSGAGFPGIPLKIVYPSLKICLVDSVKKKCDFMKEVCRKLGLENVSVVHKRLTDSEPATGIHFLVAISRAALHLSDFLKIASANLRSGGMAIAMKGDEIADEIDEAQFAMKKYGFSEIKSMPYQLPFSGRKMRLVTLIKI